MNTQTLSGALGYRIESGAADVAELGYRFLAGTSKTSWETDGRRLGKQEKALPWKIGDWAFYGEGEYGATYDEMCKITGLEYQTIANYVSVAGRFEIYRRRENLSFSHHSEVASLGSDVEQDEWLDKAVQEGWSSKELRRALSEGGEVRDASADVEGSGEDNEPASPSSENAILASTLEALRLTLTTEDAREIVARADLEGISASAWLRRYLDELRASA